MRVYLDNCCYNRPYDDQRNILNLVETEAKLVIQQRIKDKTLGMVWSDVLDYENHDNPFEERRIKIAEWRKLASTIIEMDDEIVEYARKLMALGLHQKDASHIACAIFAQSDYFITVDKKILNKPISDIIVINPLDFLRRILNDD
jgi:predicted nucleic acid-binding protein